MTEVHKSGSKVSRRTIAKGAAWSVPVVAVAAAAPAASASTTPTCPENCAAALTNAVTLSTGVFNKGTNTADLSIIAGAFVANFLTTGCGQDGLLQASLFTVTSSTLTMSDGATYTTTSGLPVGVSAASLSTLADIGTTFSDVQFPNGNILQGVLNAPVKPASICFEYNLVLNILGSGTPPQTQTCPGQVCFGFNLLGTSVYSVNQAIVPNTVTFAATGLAL